MFEFKRGINEAFIKRLNAEYELGGWWAAIADDSSLFVAIRDNYISVYSGGNSLLELRLVNDELIGRTHYKYLLKPDRSEEHTSELQSLMRISYAVFCLTNKNTQQKYTQLTQQIEHT